MALPPPLDSGGEGKQRVGAQSNGGGSLPSSSSSILAARVASCPCPAARHLTTHRRPHPNGPPRAAPFALSPPALLLLFFWATLRRARATARARARRRCRSTRARRRRRRCPAGAAVAAAKPRAATADSSLRAASRRAAASEPVCSVRDSESFHQQRRERMARKGAAWSSDDSRQQAAAFRRSGDSARRRLEWPRSWGGTANPGGPMPCGHVCCTCVAPKTGLAWPSAWLETRN